MNSFTGYFLTSSRKKKIVFSWGEKYWKKAKRMQVCVLVCVICYDIILPVAVQNSYIKTIKPERRKEGKEGVLYCLSAKQKEK